MDAPGLGARSQSAPPPQLQPNPGRLTSAAAVQPPSPVAAGSGSRGSSLPPGGRDPASGGPALAGYLWNKGGQKEDGGKKESWKKGQRRNWRQRYFTQAGRMLIFHGTSDEALKHMPPLGRVDLAFFELREREPTAERQWAFVLASADKDYPLCANSAEEKRIWMDSIRAAQAEATHLSDSGPVLVSSSNSSMKMHLQQSAAGDLAGSDDGGQAAVSEGLPPRRFRDEVDSSDEDEDESESGPADSRLRMSTATPMEYRDFSDASAAERQQLRAGSSATRQVAKRQGWLDKKADNRKSWGKRYFVLSQQQFTYYREEPGMQTEARGVFDLTTFSIEAGDTAQMSFILKSKDLTMVLRAEEVMNMTSWIKEIAKGIDIGKVAAAVEAEMASQADLEDSEVAVERPDNAQLQPRGDVSRLLWSHIHGSVLMVGRAGVELMQPNPQNPTQASRPQKSVFVRQVGKANATITSCTSNDELVVLGMSDGRVIGIDARALVVTWEIAVSRSDILCLCLDETESGDALLWCGAEDGAITQIELDDILTEQPRVGFTQSATPTPEWAPVVAIATAGGLVWTATFGQVSVCAWDMRSRTCVTTVYCTFRATSMLSRGSEVWVGQGDGGIVAFNAGGSYQQVGNLVSNASEVKRLVDTGRRVWSMHANGTVRVCQMSTDTEWGQTTWDLSLLASFPAQNSLVDAVLVPIDGFEPHMWTASSVGSLRVWNASFPDTRDQLIKKRLADRISEYTETRTLKVRVVTHNVAEDPPSRDGNRGLRDVWCGAPGDKATFAEHRGFEDVHYVELSAWLTAHGVTDIDVVVGAMEAAEFPQDTWVDELNGMEADGSLPAFLEAVKQMTDRHARFDVIAIGLQEVEMTGKALAQGVAGRETKMGQDWRKHMNTILEKEGYVCAGGRQLVGLFCAVYVHRSHEKYMHDVHVKVVGCGLGGFAGNKGGIVVRLKLYETELNFINTHLAAHMGHVSKRNEDFESVADALVPELVAIPPERRNGQPLTIKPAVPLIWFGDLNYRIPLEFDAVVDAIDSGNLEDIIKADQLVGEQSAGRVFAGFTESPIFFNPTYKFRQGAQHTSPEKPFGDYDRRMKKKSAAKGGGKKPPRVPAYCDRVLWCGPGIRPLLPEVTDNHPLGYTSHPIITASDHKPVSHSLLVDAQKVIPHFKEAVRDTVLQEVSVESNESKPALRLSALELEFGALRFGDPAKKLSVVITNGGSAAAQFHFDTVAHDGSRRKMPPPWLRISPMSGQVLPGSSVTVRLSMQLNRDVSASVAPSGVLNVQLQLHCHGSATVKPTESDISLFCHAKRMLGVVGLGLSDLCRRPYPVRGEGVDPKVILPDGQRGAGRTRPDLPGVLPEEYQALIEWLRKAPASTRLFVEDGDAEERLLVQELLETVGDINSFQGSPCSAADCLLDWLDQLPQPVFPAALHGEAFHAAQSSGMAGALAVVKQLPAQQKAALHQMLRLCNAFVPRGIEPVWRFLNERQQPVLGTAGVVRGPAGFGIVMDDAALVVGGPGSTCESIPLGATVVQVGQTPVRDKQEIVGLIGRVPAGQVVQFTFRHTNSAEQQTQLHGILQALRAAEIPSHTWVTELIGAQLNPLSNHDPIHRFV